mgnify:CR=1 FL=1
MTMRKLKELERLLSKMKPGPYEYWDNDSNDLIVARCKTPGKGVPIAALPGMSSMRDEFTAICALLNDAPSLISLAKQAFKKT